MSPPFPGDHDLLKGILSTLSCQVLELNSGQEQLWGSNESNVGVLEGAEHGWTGSSQLPLLWSLSR